MATYAEDENEKRLVGQASVTPNGAGQGEAPGVTYTGMEDILRELERTAPESDADKAKRKRREKWQAIISGIGDAVSSLGNLYFTTKGAPNMYDPRQSLSAKALERFDKAREERKARAREHRQLLLKHGELKDAAAQRKWLRQQKEAEVARAEAEAKQKQDNWEAEAKQKQGNWEAEAKQKAQQHKDRMAQQAAENARKAEHDRQMRALGWAKVNKGKKTYKFNGVTYDDEVSWKQAVDRYYEDNPDAVWPTEVTSTTSENVRNGLKTTTTGTSTKKTGNYAKAAAAAEKHAADKPAKAAAAAEAKKKMHAAAARLKNMVGGKPKKRKTADL